MPLDLTALRRPPTAEEVARARRSRSGAAPHPTSRTLVLALVTGGVLAAVLIFSVLVEDQGPVVAGLVGGAFLVADLTAASYLTRNLKRAVDQRRASVQRFARDNDLDPDERPSRTDVPGRVLGHPTATVLRRWRSRRRPVWETGVVQHQATAAPAQRTTRYVALDAGRRLPRLLLAAPAPTNRPGAATSPVELVPYHLEGLWPAVDEALPSGVTRVGEEDQAAHVFGEDVLVHADAVVARVYPQVLDVGLTARFVRLGIGSLEVADGWLVATTAVRGGEHQVAEWRRVEQVLDLLEDLRGRLAAL